MTPIKETRLYKWPKAVVDSMRYNPIDTSIAVALITSAATWVVVRILTAGSRGMDRFFDSYGDFLGSFIGILGAVFAAWLTTEPIRRRDSERRLSELRVAADMLCRQSDELLETLTGVRRRANYEIEMIEKRDTLEKGKIELWLYGVGNCILHTPTQRLPELDRPSFALVLPYLKGKNRYYEGKRLFDVAIVRLRHERDCHLGSEAGETNEDNVETFVRECLTDINSACAAVWSSREQFAKLAYATKW